jgi:hypothetical protein
LYINQVKEQIFTNILKLHVDITPNYIENDKSNAW